MGKKIFCIAEKLKPKFIDGGKSNGHPEEILEKDMEGLGSICSLCF